VGNKFRVIWSSGQHQQVGQCDAWFPRRLKQ